MGMEGPEKQAPQETLAQKQAEADRISGIRERAQKAQEEGSLSPEGEMMLLRIEEKERELNEAISELQQQISELESMKARDIPEEKSDWYMGTVSDSYEKAVKRINAATVGVIGASLLALDAGILGNMPELAKAGALGGYVFPALWTVGQGFNLLRAKISEWKSDWEISRKMNSSSANS